MLSFGHYLSPRTMHALQPTPFALCLSLLLLTSGSILAQQASPADTTINWPEAYAPEDARFYVQNAIDINASPEAVWAILMDAEAWPEWYEGAKDVQVITTEDGQLHQDAVMRWKTMGLRFESTIMEFEAPYRLGWESKKSSIRGYHAWLIIPTATGCRVLTEESQRGWLTLMERIFQPKKLHRLHDEWLEGLKAKAEATPVAN